MNPTAALVLEAIKDLSRTQPMPPTYREVAEHLGWKAHSRVHKYVRELRKEGLLYDPQNGAARALLLPPRGSSRRW